MNVEYIDHMGSDLAVVDAARVSFAKQSAWDHDALSERDVRLVAYLAEHNHWSPFTHCVVKLRVKAPLFVARQLWKSHIGLASQDDSVGWNEVSRRYVDNEPEFYIPSVWRKRAENVKQGSSDEAHEGSGYLIAKYKVVIDQAFGLYEQMIAQGVAPEQARMVLPASVYTEWIWTASLCALARIYKQRTDDHAQRETKEIADRIGEIASGLFPVSWEALTQ